MLKKNIYLTKSYLLIVLFFICVISKSYSQEVSADKPKEDHSYKPLLFKFSDDGKKFMRMILWGQFQLYTNDLNSGINSPSADGKSVDHSVALDFRVRRVRMLVFTQFSSRFFLLFHIGANNIQPNNLTAAGTTSGTSVSRSTFFVHDIWGEFKVTNNNALFVGAGLHYWQGLSRLTLSSTLNFLAMDNAFANSWHSLGSTDQFARNLGVYVKGDIKKLHYQFSANRSGEYDLLSNYQDNGAVTKGNTFTNGNFEQYVYATAGTLGAKSLKGDWLYNGYIKYQFWDAEDHKLPFAVGTYLGAKKVLNLGVGFSVHPDGLIKTKTPATTTYTDHTTLTTTAGHFAADLFMELPFGEKGVRGALNALLTYYNFNFGENYNVTTNGRINSTASITSGLSGSAMHASYPRLFSGNVVNVMFGYLLPKFSEKIRLQPYARFNLLAPNDATRNGKSYVFNSGYDMGYGLNILFAGHNNKLTFEFTNIKTPYISTTTDISGSGEPDGVSVLWLQYHIFI